MTAPKRTRGRPRTQEVIDRDEMVFQAVAGSDRAVTKYEISAGTGIELVKVYMSLRRLAQADRLARVYIINKQHYWSNRKFDKPNVEPEPALQPENIPAMVFSSPE